MAKKIGILLFVVSLCLINGCNYFSTAPQKTLIRVTFFETGAKKVLFDAYQILHPEVEFEFRHAPNMSKKENLKFLDSELENSDLIVAEETIFRKLVEEGKLKSLDGKIKKDWNWQDYEPSLKKSIQVASGQQEIFGMVPTYNSHTFLCNAPEFKGAGIDIPTQQLTWDEFIELNQKLTANLQKPSLLMSYIAPAATFQRLYAKSMRLRMFDPTTKKIALNTAGWKKAWLETLKVIENGVLKTTDLDWTNHTAVVLGDSTFNYKKNEHIQPICIPKFEAHDTNNPTIVLGSFYAISNTSVHDEEVWKVIKYMMEDDLPRRPGSYFTFFSNKKVNEEKIAPFKFGSYQGPSDYIYGDFNEQSTYKEVFKYGFDKYTESLIHQVIKKEISLDEAMHAWQMEGEKIIEKYKKEE